jgi:Kdo2-lipid IVA lauroyltransferase/acyltransferase
MRYTVETLKVGNMPEAGLASRMTFKNCELLNSYYDQGKSVVVMAMHYGNWEWLLHMPLFIKHHQYFVYKPMQNEWFGRYLNEMRSRFGGETVSMNIALRKIIEAENKGIPVMTWLAADQTPPWNHPFWTIFLNQETQFFEGPAKIARRFSQPVILQIIRRTGRGYYEANFEVLFENPQEVSEETIILTYVRKIESIVNAEPYPYLWSHRRWKHTRPPGTPLH